MHLSLQSTRDWRRRLAGGLVGALMTCPPPFIPDLLPALEPSFGPSGTLAVLTAESDVSSVTVGDFPAPIRGASGIYLLTVPYDLDGVCTYPVIVTFTDPHLKPKTLAFKVTQRVGRPAPVVENEPEIGYYNSGGVTYPNVLELVVYGVGFDTESVIQVDGRPIDTFAAGFGMKNGHDIVLDKLRAYCKTPCPSALVSDRTVSCYERTLVGLMQASQLLPGTVHAITVASTASGSSSSASVDFRMPVRKLTLQLDHLAGFLEEVPYEAPLPTPLTCHDGRLITWRRTFASAGLALDLVTGQEQRHSLARPGSSPELGAAVSEQDLFDFFRMMPPPGAAEWNVRGLMLTKMERDGRPLDTSYGVRVNEPGAYGFAVFSSLLKQDPDMLLRTSMHELGHALGLTHCHGEPEGITLMNDCIDDSWNFELSPAARDCLSRTIQAAALPTSRFRTFDPNEQNACCRGKLVPPVVFCGDPPAALASPLASLTPPSAAGLELTLTGPSTIQRGVPLVLRATLENKNASPADVLPFLDPSDGETSYIITSPTGAAKPFIPYFSYEVSGEGRKVETGTRIEGNALISCPVDGYAFLDAATEPYTIVAVYHGLRGDLAGQAVISRPFAVKVTDTPDLHDDGGILASADVCRFLSLGGARTLPQARELLSKVAQHGAGELGRYANLALGLATLSQVVPLPEGANPADEALPYLKAADSARAGMQDYFNLRLTDALVESALTKRSPDYRQANEYFNRLKEEHGNDFLAQPTIQLRQRQLQDYTLGQRVPINAEHLLNHLRDRCRIDTPILRSHYTAIDGIRERVKRVTDVHVLSDKVENLPIRLEGTEAVITVPLAPIDGVNIEDHSVEIAVPASRHHLHVPVSISDLGLPEEFLRRFQPRPSDLAIDVPLNVPCFASSPLQRDVWFELSSDPWSHISMDGNRATIDVLVKYIDLAGQPHESPHSVRFSRIAHQ